MNTKIIAATVVVLLLLGGAALLLSQKKSTKSVMNSTTEKVVTPTMAMSPSAMKEEASPSSAMESVLGTPAASGTAQKGTVKEFTVTASNYKFSPATLAVNKGDTVKITFTNSQGFHDFVIDEFNVKTKTIPSGQSETVTFTADKAGTFDYYCSVANHRQMGMQGTLTVK